MLTEQSANKVSTEVFGKMPNNGQLLNSSIISIVGHFRGARRWIHSNISIITKDGHETVH